MIGHLFTIIISFTRGILKPVHFQALTKVQKYRKVECATVHVVKFVTEHATVVKLTTQLVIVVKFAGRYRQH